MRGTMADLLGYYLRFGQFVVEEHGAVSFVGCRRLPESRWWDVVYQSADGDVAHDLEQHVLTGSDTELPVGRMSNDWPWEEGGLGMGVAVCPDGSALVAYGSGWTLAKGQGSEIYTYRCRDWDHLAPFIQDVGYLVTSDDWYIVSGCGLAGWDGIYMPNGTHNGYTAYQQSGGTHWMLWETYMTVYGWGLFTSNTPSIPADLVYFSLEDHLGDPPDSQLWTRADPAYDPPPYVWHDGLMHPFVVSDDLGHWIVCRTYSGGVRTFRRMTWALSGDDTWHVTETAPLAAYGDLTEPSCAILPDGSILVAASINDYSGYRFARTRDDGATWDEITTADLIGEGLTLGSIAADDEGSVYLVGWIGDEVRLHIADADTGTGYDLRRKTLSGSDDYIKVCDAVAADQVPWRSRVWVHPGDGSVLVAVANPVVTGDYPEWSTDWYRMRDLDEGFVGI